MSYEDLVEEQRNTGEWERLGFSSPEAFADAREASMTMLDVEYRMAVDDKLPEGYKFGEGPGGLLSALGLHGVPEEDMPPANIRHYNSPLGTDTHRMLGSYTPPSVDRQLLQREFKDVMSTMTSPAPIQPDTILLDSTQQGDTPENRANRGKRSYEDTLLHELRHRGVHSDLYDELLREGSKVLSDKPSIATREDNAALNTVRRIEHPIYEVISKMVLEDDPDLMMHEESYIDYITRAEKLLAESLTEEQLMRLGILPESEYWPKKEEAGFLDELLGIMD